MTNTDEKQEENIDQLNNRRSIVLGYFGKLDGRIKKHASSPLTVDEANKFLKNVRDWHNELDELYTKLEPLTTDPEVLKKNMSDFQMVKDSIPQFNHNLETIIKRIEARQKIDAYNDLLGRRDALVINVEDLETKLSTHPKSKLNKNILHACKGNHRLYKDEADRVLSALIAGANAEVQKENNDIFTKIYSTLTTIAGHIRRIEKELEDEQKESKPTAPNSFEIKFKFIYGRFQTIHEKVFANEDFDTVTLQKMSSNLKMLSEQASALTNEIADHVEAKDIDSAITQISDLVNSMDDTDMALSRLINLSTKAKHKEHGNSSNRYKKLDPPKFNSNDTEWNTFKGLFEDFIAEEELSGRQKLQQLRECVSGEALQLINLCELSDDGFESAWNKLVKRYEDVRRLTSIHLKTILELPASINDSAINLRKLIDPFEQALSQLSIIEPNKEKRYDIVMAHLLYRKLDKKTQEEFNKNQDKDELPEVEDLIEFIEDYAKIKSLNVDSTSNQKKDKNFQKKASSHVTSSTATCKICEDSHFTYQCSKLNAAEVSERLSMIDKKKLCRLCLRPSSKNHTVQNCRTKFRCKECKGNHHSLLHQEKKKETKEEKKEDKKEETTSSFHISTLTADDGDQSQVLLPTAIVNIENEEENIHPIRALLDGGSQVNFISSQFLKILRLKKFKSPVTLRISGVGGKDCGRTKGSVYININSNYGNFSVKNLHCYILPQITIHQPQEIVPEEKWSHLKNLHLADPNFHTPSRIDLLLGTEVTYRSQLPGKRHGAHGELSAYETEFGWVVPGSFSSTSPIFTTLTCNLDKELQRFWDQEEILEEDSTSEGKLVEEHFRLTHTRNDQGRFQVRLPFKNNSVKLGESKSQAISRFINLEKRLEKNQDLKLKYSEGINKLIELGHVEEVPENELNKSPHECFYLPHHAVIKESSKTTKVRLVFDGSAKTTTGVSLNEQLGVGDTIQPELASTLNRFRCHMIALCADIKQMYHQVIVHPKDRDYLRFIWRDSPKSKLRILRKKKVTFGISSAAFLVIRSLQELAHIEGKDFPLAVEALLKEFYVDNLHGGMETEEDAIELYRQLEELTQRGGFELCQWSSNSEKVMSVIPKEKREFSFPLSIQESDSVKTLGIQWNPEEDYFSFKVTTPESPLNTKRKILSHIAKLYDPEGWFGPVIVSAKIIMQELWKSKQGWDEEITPVIQKEWNQYCSNLKLIEEIKIPRKLVKPNPIKVELHGFCDASSKAYGAVVYLRSQYSNGEYLVRLISAKSRVVAIKTSQSIPRLELTGAVLLCKLMEFVRLSIEEVVKINEIHLWTDSSVALHWISSTPEKWKPFVSNRVKKINETTTFDQWHHIETKKNPADCLSRGKTPKKLKEFKLWWCPEFLCQELDFNSSLIIIKNPKDLKEVDIEERKNQVTTTLHVQISDSIFKRFSSWNRIRRTFAQILRFPKIVKDKSFVSSNPVITTTEIIEAEKKIIIWAQKQSFSSEIYSLNNKENLNKNSKLSKLYPFIDKDGVLRVSGRLNNSCVPDSQKYPVILCGSHPITKLIIEDFHRILGHAGPQLLLSTINEKYWIIRGRQLVKSVVYNCLICHRLQLQAASQLMGQLPSPRVNPSPAFSSTGVDFAGPFKIKRNINPLARGRAAEPIKVYAAVFICLVTKAIHIELALSLSTPAFMEVLNKFIGRRGKPEVIYSDNGKNFEGAASELKEIQKFLLKNNSEITEKLSLQKIKWNFIPPRSPHHGGLWEAGVKSMKFHLKRITKDKVLAYNELETVLIQVEAILNSRPLCPISSEPSNMEALTPGHFLIQRSLTSCPQYDFTDVPENRLSRWEKIQSITQHLWKRWSSDYLSTLQQRPKWWNPQKNVEKGQLVIMIQSNVPPLMWKLARVEEVHPGADGRVRVVTVKTNGKYNDKNELIFSTYRRPITKIALLPSECEELKNLDEEAEAKRS